MDSSFEFPENYAELGFRLKDKRQPDNKQAIEKINVAIRGFGVKEDIGYKAISCYNRGLFPHSVGSELFIRSQATRFRKDKGPDPIWLNEGSKES